MSQSGASFAPEWCSAICAFTLCSHARALTCVCVCVPLCALMCLLAVVCSDLYAALICVLLRVFSHMGGWMGLDTASVHPNTSATSLVPFLCNWR